MAPITSPKYSFTFRFPATSPGFSDEAKPLAGTLIDGCQIPGSVPVSTLERLTLAENIPSRKHGIEVDTALLYTPMERLTISNSKSDFPLANNIQNKSTATASSYFSPFSNRIVYEPMPKRRRSFDDAPGSNNHSGKENVIGSPTLGRRKRAFRSNSIPVAPLRRLNVIPEESADVASSELQPPTKRCKALSAGNSPIRQGDANQKKKMAFSDVDNAVKRPRDLSSIISCGGIVGGGSKSSLRKRAFSTAKPVRFTSGSFEGTEGNKFCGKTEGRGK